MKAHDPTRLALISQVNMGQSPKTDFDDYHYPPVPQMKTMLNKPQPRQSPRHLLPRSAASRIRGVRFWPTIGIPSGLPTASPALSSGNGRNRIWPTGFPSAGPFRAPARRASTARNRHAARGRRRRCHRRSPDQAQSVLEPQDGLQPGDDRGPRGGPGGRPMRRPAPEPLLVHRSLRTYLPLAGAGWREGTGPRRKPHRRQTPLHRRCRLSPPRAGMDTLRLEFIHPDGRSIYAARLHVKGYARPGRSRRPGCRRAGSPLRDGPECRRANRRNTNWSSTSAPARSPPGGPATRTLSLADPSSTSVNRSNDDDCAVSVAAAVAAARHQSAAPSRRNFATPSSRPTWMAPTPRSRVTAMFTWPAPTSSRPNSITPSISPEAQADLSWNLAWKAADATAREAGLKFLLPAKSDRMSWFSDSLWTEYPADHIANPHGSATSKDWLSVPPGAISTGCRSRTPAIAVSSRSAAADPCTRTAASRTMASCCSSAAASPRPAGT